MRRIALRNAGCAAGLLLAATGWSLGQTLKVRPPAEQNAQQEEAQKPDARGVDCPASESSPRGRENDHRRNHGAASRE